MDGLKRCEGKQDKTQKPAIKKQNKNPKLAEGLNGCWLHNKKLNKPKMIETEPKIEQTDTDVEQNTNGGTESGS